METVLFDLSKRSKVELAGPEARTFLHNLCTQDIKNLPVGAGCEAFLIGAKGKVIAHVLVGHFQHGDTPVLWLDAVAGQAAAILEHLNRYLISEQVELADRTDELGMFHLGGPKAASILHGLTGEDYSGLLHLHHRAVDWPIDGRPRCQVRRNTGLGLDGYDILCGATAAATVCQSLRDAGALSAGPDVYETLRIEAGLPEFGRDFDTQRFVMEIGRTAQAICQTKGCYLGQESVVMARDRGQVNRMLMGVKATGDQPLAPGSQILRGADEVGQVTSSTYSPRLGQTIALAYLRRGCQEPGTELMAEDRPVVVCALPFLPLAD